MEQKLTLEQRTQGMLARMSLKQWEQWVPRLEGSRKAATGSSYRRVDPAFLCKFRFKENCRGFTIILITRLFHYFLFSILVTTVTWNEQWRQPCAEFLHTGLEKKRLDDVFKDGAFIKAQSYVLFTGKIKISSAWNFASLNKCLKRFTAFLYPLTS